MSKPWESCPHIWKSEKQYLQWLRSQSRRIWNTHPLKLEYIKQRRIPYAPSMHNKIRGRITIRAKWCIECEMCHNLFALSQVQVDHIDGAGSFSSIEEWHRWLDKLLLIGFDDIRILCKTCHGHVTYSQRSGCSIEEAGVEKKIAAFTSMTANVQRKELTALGIVPAVNSKLRKAQYAEYIRSSRPNVQQEVPSTSG